MLITWVGGAQVEPRLHVTLRFTEENHSFFAGFIDIRIHRFFQYKQASSPP